MNVYLYYVEGISRIDTPYFATKTIQASLSKQEEFFDNHLVKTVELSFYPPHYYNSIRFEEEDLTIMDSVNYLALEYNGKRYYYFIDDVEYISETLIEVSITMDVIQTYMFDIYIANGIIERRFIDRWIYDDDGYVINRAYLRENVSNNEFMPVSKSFVNLDNRHEYMLFIKQTKVDKTSTVQNIAPHISISYMLPNGSYATRMNNNIEIPFDIKFGPASYYRWYETGYQQKITSMANLVSHCSYIAETIDMYICPFNPYKEIIISSPTNLECAVSGQYQYSMECNYLNFDDMHIADPVYYFRSSPNILVVKDSYYTFTYSRNTNLTAQFLPQYMPMLLDDNYIRYTFGTSVASTTFPLYKLDNVTIHGHYTFDPSNGSRIYFINTTANSDLDTYNTLVVDTNILSVDLKNDPWAQYIANNKNRWAQLNNNNIGSIASAAANYAGSSSKIGRIGIDKQSNTEFKYAKIQARNKKGQFTKAAVRRIGSEKTSTSRDVYGDVPTNASGGGIASAAMGAITGVFNQYYTEKNLLAAPASLSQLGEANNGVVSQSHLIYHYVERVIDYSQCANYYHRNGYLVNTYVNAVPNIFAYVQNRYYFNVLKMQNANVHLHGVIEDESTCDAIAERLGDGLRLWNVNNSGVTIGNFYYDNLEYSFIL